MKNKEANYLSKTIRKRKMKEIRNQKSTIKNES